VVRVEAWFAPVARIKATGRFVFLLAWDQDKHSIWRGHVAWLVRENMWRGVDTWMRADDLEAVKGQGYRRVPRRRGEADF
jgi:hypothetical protein